MTANRTKNKDNIVYIYINGGKQKRRLCKICKEVILGKQLSAIYCKDCYTKRKIQKRKEFIENKKYKR